MYKLPAVVAVNKFPTDTDAEVQLVIDKCAELGVKAVLSDVWAKGGKRGNRACGGSSFAREKMIIPDFLSVMSLKEVLKIR